jgi:hypothetical protein
MGRYLFRIGFVARRDLYFPGRFKYIRLLAYSQCQMRQSQWLENSTKILKTVILALEKSSN